ncbi:Transposase family tnp2 [Ceratobasidium sp. AG-Ba]|nr:Transposase family tnp2 [Ceratobasidium sp. AG-Ba]
MEAESHENTQAAARRNKSHHKNQPTAFCHCGRCLGSVKQKPRTIEDHRTRYPREQDIRAEPRADILDVPSEANEQPIDPMYDDLQIVNGLDPHVVLQHPLDPEADLQFQPGNGSRPSTPSVFTNIAISPPRAPSIRERLNELEEAERDEPLDAFPEDQHEYAFDNLFERLAGQHGFYQIPAGQMEQIELDDDDDAQFDPDFGLPFEENDNHNHVLQYPFEFNDDLGFVADDESDADEDHPNQFMAFQEPTLIRNAYIDAFVQKHLYGATHRALKHQLKAAKRSLSAHPGIHIEELAKMAQTIGTAEKRLGLNTDSIIAVFTLCPMCRRRYSQDYIAEAESDRCLNEGCTGVLFAPKKLASGQVRRVSHITYPFASPIAWIRHILSLPGMSELMQHWRSGIEDTTGMKPPVTSEDWMRDLNPHKPMGDLYDGWGWRSIRAGLERRTNPRTGTVGDESPFQPPVRFTSLPFGLSLTLNTDWFQATKEGNYSVGACYLVINNLPRHMRFLRENISLTILMPGPNEPSSYALDQMLEPLIDDLLQLKQGVPMLVRQGDPPIFREEIVHGDLSIHIADLMARIKMGGGAGLKSELNFCLYCHMRLSSLSVPAGYDRHAFDFRDPREELDNTGNRFTALHQIPGWHTSTSSPPDTMHLLYLGATNWIVKQILVGPGMLMRRRPGDQAPQDLFNECLDRMWMPKNFQRLPPKLGQTRGTIKADQWKLTSKILFIPLFLAFRDGDEIGPGYVPRGNRSSPAAKHQSHRAKMLHQQRVKYFQALGQPEASPPVDQCYASRSLRFHYRQVLRFCVATSVIDKRSITPTEILFAQELMEALCVDYVRKNVPLAPNFHYLMHLEEFVLKYGSTYNTHVWGMERANGIVSKINHNGKKNGILEGTLMRGWWSHVAIQNLIRMLRELPDRTATDESIIEDLLSALRGELSTHSSGERLWHISHNARRLIPDCMESELSAQLRVIDLEKHRIYQLVLDFCIEYWPDAGIFGPGMPRQRYLAPEGMVRNHSYVELNGVRYGAWEHTSGVGYCYGYIDGRSPVRIDRILSIEIPGVPYMHCICALVRSFCPALVEAQFPWDTWAGHLGVSSWAYGQLTELTAIPVHRFSGALALFDITMSYGRYWVTVSLDNIAPEREDHGDEE